MTVENGCLWYLPGTHRTATHRNVYIDGNFGGLFAHYPAWRAIEPVACPCPAGSVVFHNCLTAHAAGVNMSPRVRRALACSFLTLRAGDVLDNDAINPLVWRKDQRALPAP